MARETIIDNGDGNPTRIVARHKPGWILWALYLLLVLGAILDHTWYVKTIGIAFAALTVVFLWQKATGRAPTAKK